jgi:ribulose-bisphosphate carboxylase large chain
VREPAEFLSQRGFALLLSPVDTPAPLLHLRFMHPYLGRSPISTPEQEADALRTLNAGRDNSRGPAVEVVYWFRVEHPGGAPLAGIANAAKMVLEHGTLKPWHSEGDPSVAKPAGYDEQMSWATGISLLESEPARGCESGLVTIACPLAFFDRRAGGAPSLAQLAMAVASEPAFAFAFYRGARIVDVRVPPALAARFPGQRWPHRRVRSYLGLADDEPIIGTIVKPKTGLTPELFSRSVVEAARAGARFTKADENMHLSLADVPRFVGRVVRDLRAAGFDLGRDAVAKGRRFLFAPHVTADPDQAEAYAEAALEAGANALMLSPFYGGGHLAMARIVGRWDVPVYAHTAGMNVATGSPEWGIDPRVMYVLAALSGAAFMQLPSVRSYLRPTDEEKPPILEALRRHGLEGADGMTLAIAGGMGPKVIGANMEALGETGRMFLAGTSVYSHPDGPSAGVRAIILAWQAYRERHAVDAAELRRYAVALGPAGAPLLHAL